MCVCVCLCLVQDELQTVLQERGLPLLFEGYAAEERLTDIVPGDCEEIWEAREKAKVTRAGPHALTSPLTNSHVRTTPTTEGVP